MRSAWFSSLLQPRRGYVDPVALSSPHMSPRFPGMFCLGCHCVSKDSMTLRLLF